MTDNGTIEISVGGKLVQLTPQQIAVVSQKIQEKYGEALDGARSAIVKAVEGCPTTIDYSKSGNVRTQVQLPKGVSCYMGQLYFNHTGMDSASKMHKACLNEFPQAVDKLKGKLDAEINAKSQKLQAEAEAKKK